jgi:DNA-binding transcriptional ArsR family regulator
MPTVFSALAEPNRLHIVELLRDGPRSVNEIVGGLGLKQPLISKHLRTLSAAGIVRMRPRAQQRIYELEAARFKELSAWLESFAELWAKRLDRLDNYLQTMQGRNDREQ